MLEVPGSEVRIYVTTFTISRFCRSKSFTVFRVYCVAHFNAAQGTSKPPYILHIHTMCVRVCVHTHINIYVRVEFCIITHTCIYIQSHVPMNLEVARRVSTSGQKV